MVQYGVYGGRHVVQDAGDVRHDLIYVQHHHRRLLIQAIDGIQALSMEGRPADEEGDHYSNCNQKNRAALEGRATTAELGVNTKCGGLAGSSLHIQIVHRRDGGLQTRIKGCCASGKTDSSILTI